VDGAPRERLHTFSLYQCGQCGLQFWHPMRMAGQAWYETAFMGRDQSMESLRVWHKYFLQDARRMAPGKKLFDIGCGTGNLLAAARRLGFSVAGTELDRNAARLAKELLGDVPVYGLALSDFAREHSEKFDVVTFFEVLEHQDRPREFLRLVRSCLKPGGYAGLSVPNRARWRYAREFVDIPPSHLTRWDAPALRTFLENNGFEVVHVREQPVNVAYAAGLISSHLRTGLVGMLAGERHRTLTELAAMDPHEARQVVHRWEFAWRHRLGYRLTRVKNHVLWPWAMVAVPYVRLRGFKGEDLYCLARLRS
jgi:SAM-dependent methyltransferase